MLFQHDVRLSLTRAMASAFDRNLSDSCLQAGRMFATRPSIQLIIHTVATYDKKLHFSVPGSGHFLFLGQNQGL